MPTSISLIASLTLIASIVSPVDYLVENRGAWPESWPAELEPLRERSRTLMGPIVLLQHYAIPFEHRDDFEAAWPHLLSVKSPGAPIVLRKGPSFWLGGKATAGVCVHTPPANEEPKPGHDIRNGDWGRTIYIELIVDGEVVDLNRIQFPPNTPIIDERFKEAGNE